MEVLFKNKYQICTEHTLVQGALKQKFDTDTRYCMVVDFLFLEKVERVNLCNYLTEPLVIPEIICFWKMR